MFAFGYTYQGNVLHSTENLQIRATLLIYN